MYTTDDRASNLDYEKIFGWRTGGGGPPANAKSVADACQMELRMYDPFIYEPVTINKSINYRYYKNGVKHVGNKVVPFIDLKFEFQTRTLKEWREIRSVFLKLVSEGIISGSKCPEVYTKGMYMVRKVNKYNDRVCGKPYYRSSRLQRPVLHSKYEWDREPVFRNDIPIFPHLTSIYRWTSIDTQHIAHHNIAETGSLPLTGPENPFFNFPPTLQYYSDWVAEKKSDFCADPINTLEGQVGTLAAIMWPSPEDLTDDDTASPLIDVAEAVSDGTILGTPPSPTDATRILTERSGVDSKYLATLDKLSESISFAVNSWLWWQLAARPVYSSMVALSASVKANDNRIAKLNDLATSSKWVQGKSRRIYSDASKDCFGSEDSFYMPGTDGRVIDSATETVAVEHFEANASFVYQLGLDNLVVGSGQQLSLFFNSLSTSLADVAYNLVPMSFVFDWFSHRYSGPIDLSSKTYMNVRESKLTFSHKSILSFKREYTASCSVIVARACGWPISSNIRCFKNYVGNPTYFFNVTELPPTGSCLEYEVLGESNLSIDETTTMRYERYDRRVIDNPTRNYVGIPCQDILSEPSTGQLVTLGALVWSNLIA